jgi:hypothetical protein
VNFFRANQIGCVSYTGLNVLDFKVGIVFCDHLGERDILLDQLKHVFNGDPGACDTGLSEMDLGIDYYPPFMSPFVSDLFPPNVETVAPISVALYKSCGFFTI